MTSPHNVEQLTPHLTRELVDNGRIVIFTITEMTRTTVDAWIEGCLAYMRDCVTKEYPMLVLQDLSDPNVTQTPYSKERGAEATTAMPELSGRTAFVLPKTAAALRIQFFIRGQSNHHRQREAFFDRDSALAWLREALDS